MGKDKRPVLTLPQHALLKRAEEFGGHIGTPGRVPPLAMQFLASVTVQHTNPHGVLKALRNDGWIRMDDDAYAFDPGDFPAHVAHLKGARPRSVPDNGVRNAARHWKAGERGLSERHLLASPEGFVEDTPPEPATPPTRAKGDDRLVASSAPPKSGTGKKKKADPPPASPRTPRLTMTAEGIDTILFRHVLAEDEGGGPLTLHASGEIFRGQVSETQGYAARMKLKEDRLYEPVHVNSSTVLWRVTAAGRARIAAKLTAHRAPKPAAETAAPIPVPAASAPPVQPSQQKEQQMSSRITHEPSTWPERPVEKGGTRETYPKKKVDGIELDDVDKAIVEACRGREDYPALRVQIMRARRLSPGQVDGWNAKLTREGGKPAAAPPPPPPPAPKPAAEPTSARVRNGVLVPEEAAELDALIKERGRLQGLEEKDLAKLDEIATRRRVRRAKRNGLDARIAELRAKGGIP